MNTYVLIRNISCAVLLCLAPQWAIAADRVIVDGAKNPERIPDRTAWLMLFRSVADGPNAPDRPTRAALLGTSGLSSVDINTVILAANEALARIHSMEGPILNAFPASEKAAAMRAQRDEILLDVVTSLCQRLTPEAAEKFRVHIRERVKRRIRITE